VYQAILISHMPVWSQKTSAIAGIRWRRKGTLPQAFPANCQQFVPKTEQNYPVGGPAAFAISVL
jgi:hypothetical protein